VSIEQVAGWARGRLGRFGLENVLRLLGIEQRFAEGRARSLTPLHRLSCPGYRITRYAIITQWCPNNFYLRLSI